MEIYVKRGAKIFLKVEYKRSVKDVKRQKEKSK